MHRKLILAGSALVLLSLVAGAQAYHITGSVGPIGSSHNWTGPGEATGATMGLVGFVICEQDGPVATPGIFGLCSMAPGYSGSGLSCTFTGRSNGNSCGSLLSGPEWFAIQMTDSEGDPVPFYGSVGGHGCGVASETFVFDAAYMYTTDDGHVSGMPVRSAGYLGDRYFANPPPNPLALGSYTIEATSDPGAYCDALFPYFNQV